MPVVGIVISYVGASMGTAAFAGTALAAYGSAIGAGIAGGLYASSQGGDFGKGFLMSAAGNFIGGQLGKAFGGAGGLSEEAFQAADYANLSGQGLSAAAIGQNMGAAAGNWAGVGSALGEIGGSSLGGSGMGELGLGSTWDNAMPVSGDMSLDQQIGPNAWEVQNTTSGLDGSPMEIGIQGGTPAQGITTYGQPELGSQWESAGMQSSGVETAPYSQPIDTSLTYNNTVGDYTTSAIPDTFTNPTGEINYSQGAPSLENLASGAQPQSVSIKDNLGKWFSDSDAKLGTMGFPKGTTAMGMVGIGSYLQGNYETYKMEQMARGLKPMTLEEYKNKVYNPNDYKAAANSMAQGGRTGTLPVLLARMNQNASSTFANNYLPTANNNWWNVNSNISNAKTANLGNITKPFAGAWAMNQGKK